ncbi:MAG: 16S rRNA (guanine(966)-N(2))-methyltransferase RsmD [Chloroflexota bacterium]|nr:MAG: 16S rRNA (guanine(966)-N(2))-methyltransferase RsmD [Chloroflexota bacterium]
MRVIAGALRGRRLVAPNDGTRPTTDRVKESIFGVVESILSRVTPNAEFGTSEVWENLRVFDLCAGSGALGIEALSRGAESARFVETRPAAIATIRQNLRNLDLASRSIVEQGDARHAGLGLRVNPALVFLDSPYEDDATPYIQAVESAISVGPDALVVVEHAHGANLPSTLGTLRLMRTRHFGATAVSIFGRGVFAETGVEDS